MLRFVWTLWLKLPYFHLKIYSFYFLFLSRNVFVKNKNYHKALFYINKALGIDEENNLYWHKYAEINLKLNLFEEAAKAYYKCIGLHDDRLEVYLALADVLHFLGEYDEAIIVMLDARETYKEQTEINYRLGGLYFLAQKEDDGIYFFEKALKSDVDYLEIIKDIFPTIIDKKEVQLLIQKFGTSF